MCCSLTTEEQQNRAAAEPRPRSPGRPPPAEPRLRHQGERRVRRGARGRATLSRAPGSVARRCRGQPDPGTLKVHRKRKIAETLEIKASPPGSRWAAARQPLVSRSSAARQPLVSRWAAAGQPLVSRWSATGQPLVSRWSAAGQPLGSRWPNVGVRPAQKTARLGTANPLNSHGIESCAGRRAPRAHASKGGRLRAGTPEPTGSGPARTRVPGSSLRTPDLGWSSGRPPTHGVEVRSVRSHLTSARPVRDPVFWGAGREF